MGGSALAQTVKAGDVFSEWTVLQADDKKSATLCRCSCGREYTVQRNRLIHGASTRCVICGRTKAGQTRTKAAGWSRTTTLILTYQRHAVDRGYSWELTRNQVCDLISQQCTYCSKQGGGIDRRDNTKGYTLENSVACCGLCNRWKSAMTLEAFLAHASAVHVTSCGQSH